MQTRPLTGALAKLAGGPRVKTDMAYATAGIARGPHTGKKLTSAPWSAVWPAPGSTLDLDFSADRYWLRGFGQGGFAQAIAFLRASNGTFIGPDGLLKGLATNLIPAVSSEFLSGWGPWGSITLGQSTEPPPVGTGTAVLTDTTTNTQHGILFSVNVIATTYTFSVYFKKGSGASAPDWLQLNIGSAWVNFNLTTLVVGISSGATGTITDVGSGWRRATLTMTFASSGLVTMYIMLTNNTDAASARPTYIGSTSSDVLIAAAQFEIGSAATPYNLSSINIPRLDWASTEQIIRQNQLVFTEAFNLWTLVGVTVNPNAATDPLGGNTADEIVASTANMGKWVERAVSFLVGPNQTATQLVSQMTVSVYAKQGTGRYLQLFGNNAFGSGRANFDLQTGTMTAQSDSFSNASIEDVGSGWFRCSAVITLTSSSATSVIYFSIIPNGTIGRAPSWTGAGETIYLWGAQLEFGSTLGVYQPTDGPTTTIPLAATPTCNGLLIESASTNQLLWCRDGTQAAWTKTNMTAALDQTGIDGVANSATSLTATSSGATCVQNITLSSASRHHSVYLKRLSGTGAVHLSADGVSWSAVDLSTSEWRRVSVTLTLANPAFSIRLMTSGDAVAMDFAQVEGEDQFRKLPSSPILTTLSAATRSGESADVRLFTSWYKEGEGTVVNVSNSGVLPPVTKNGNTYQIGTGSADNAHAARHNHKNNLVAQIVTNAASGSQVIIENSPVSPSVLPTELKTAFAFRYNSHAAAVKGVFAGIDTRFPVQRANQMNIGSAANAYVHEGTVKRITYFPRRFSDTALVALSGER